MAKLDYLQDKKLSPADELREILSSLEDSRPKIKSMDSAQALAVLADLDQVEAYLEQFEANGLDLRPERGRFEAIQGNFRRKASSLLKAVGGSTVLSNRRPSPAPPPEQWWWYIDEIVTVQQKRLFRQIGISLAIVALIIGGVILAFSTIKPSPEVVARMEAQDNAFSAVERGDYPGALAVLEEGLTIVPGDSDLLIFKGVIQQVLGEEEAADQTFVQTQRAIEPLEFYLIRTQLYLRLNQPEHAEADTRTALELDENLGRTWFLLGQTLESQGEFFEAVEAYENAGRLAFDNNENGVYVLSRMALARLSQELPTLSGEGTVEGETPEE